MDGQLPANIRLSLDRQSFLEDERGQRGLEQWLDTSSSPYPDGLTDDYDTCSVLDRLAGRSE